MGFHWYSVIDIIWVYLIVPVLIITAYFILVYFIRKAIRKHKTNKTEP